MVAPEEVQAIFVSSVMAILGQSSIPDGIEAVSTQLLEDVLVSHELIVGLPSRCRNSQAISQARAFVGRGTQRNYNAVSATLV